MTAIPQISPPDHSAPSQLGLSSPFASGHDPKGALVAFNVSRAQFDLYTNQSFGQSIKGTGGTVHWYDQNFTATQSGGFVHGTTFNVTVASGSPTNENVTWSNVNVPKGNVSSTTYLRFDWRGKLGNFTRASYFLYNVTTLVTGATRVFVNQTTISGGRPAFTTGSPPVGCGQNDECFDVTRYAGFNLTLTFAFNSTSSGKGLSVRVSNIAVVSGDAQPIPSSSHLMKLDPTDTTHLRVNHNANLTIGYFANVTYPKPNVTPTVHLNHTWSQMIATYYYPNSYQSVSIAQNGTALLPGNPISQGNCPSFFLCTSSHYISLNMTTNGIMPIGIRRAGIYITANSNNLEAGVQTTLGGAPETSWGQGDLLQVKVTLRPGVNVTGDNIVSGSRTGKVQVTQTFSTSSGGTFLENFTNPLPQDTTLLGQWAVNSTFISGYDFGFNSTLFTLEQLGVSGFTYSGSNQRLTAGGTLTYASTTAPAANVNGYVFAIDNGSTPAPITTASVTKTAGIYVRNITMVNGIFTPGGHLIMTFILVNPSTTTRMTANITINHEWISGTHHGSNATVTVPLGADTFTLQPAYVFMLNATLTPAGIHVIVTNILSGNTKSATLPSGSPPITSLRQHAGLFDITITSAPVSTSTTCVPSCVNSLESPVYAYVIVNPPLPARLLTAGSFTSTATGAYSTVINPAAILGAAKLSFLSLGRDSNGLAITVQGASTQESTQLQSSIDSIPTATQNEPLTMILHLRSNSTTINMVITVNLVLQDHSTGQNQILQTQSGISLAPGEKKDVSFNFNAPSKVGAYTVTFTSPDYGAPFVTGTLQVSTLQSGLQIILPAIIGVAVTIVILLFFLFRKKPSTATETPGKDKPTQKTKTTPDTSSSKSLT